MKRNTKYPSDEQKSNCFAYYGCIVLVAIFFLCVLLTGLQTEQKAAAISEAVAEVLTPTPEPTLAPTPQPTPEPTPITMIEKQTVMKTEYVPVVEYVEVPVEVPVEVVTYIQVPVNSTCTNRYAALDLSAYDLELLARIAWREARGEKSIGMRMVIEVVLNRVLSSQFPDTVYGVLYQPGQFSQGEGVPSLEEVVPTQAQYDAVSLVLSDTPITDDDVYFFATMALTDNVFMRVGGHYFCRNGNWY